jgi:serine/threonine-protein kinase RsbW
MDRIEPVTPSERWIRLAIESRLDQVALVGLALRGLLRDLVSDEIARNEIEVAVTEGINNAIKHAYGLKRGHEVEVIVTFHPGSLRFTICDTGRPPAIDGHTCLDFDPKDIDALPEGGMGIPLMKSIMDEVSFCRSGNKNCLVMYKRI